MSPNSHTTETSLKPKNLVIELIGDWGRWQCRSVLLIFLCKIPAAWFMACIIFTAPFAKYGEYNCQPTTESELTMNRSKWIEIAHPTMANDPSKYDFCHVYENRTESNCCENRKIDACDRFQHFSQFESLVTQFDLVCSRTILIAVTQFFHLCGVLCGGIFATKLLNSYGLHFYNNIVQN